ncbi:MAG: type II secretion system protein [Gammaproteobacteria bacterium]|nr:type II secretion system protein [Gammaproteobacteria bacterium]
MTLVELLVVLGILGIAALMMMPVMDEVNRAQAVDATVERVRAAAAFARDESRRRRTPYALRYERASMTLSVVRLDDSSTPPTVHADVLDPIAKRPYAIPLGPPAPALSLSVTHTGTCDEPELIAFTASGEPYCGVAPGVRVRSASLSFRSGESLGSLHIEAGTGALRVVEASGP